MVGQGVLRECFIDAGVAEVLSVGRSPTGAQHGKLCEILHDDFTDFSKIESRLAGYDACLFCLGVSSIGMTADAEGLSAKVRNAGAIFLGPHTPEAIGDYVGGSNHVLPTARSARFSSGLGVLDFMKRTSILKCGPDQLRALGPAAMTLGKAEGLDAHSRSVGLRLNLS